MAGRLTLPFPAEPVYRHFAAALGVEIRFDTGGDASMLFPSHVLDTPLPQGDPHIAALYERQCAALLRQRAARAGVSGRVRELLRHGAMASQAAVATDLGLGVRTLRRRLADEGRTFRDLSEETFCVIAEELLSAGLTVQQVAARLGYSSASALTRAFKTWKGQTPGRFARTRRGRRVA